MKNQDHFIKTILVHELSNKADYQVRRNFYDEITGISPYQKSMLKNIFTKVPGAKFEIIKGISILETDATASQKKKFKKEGYLFPLKLKTKYLKKIYHSISNLKFTNRINQTTIKGNSFTKFLLENKSLPEIEGTYWLNSGTTENQKLIALKIMQQIAFDPKLLNLVAEYLGSTPIHVATNIWISGKSKDKLEISRNAQEYHQDCGFVNFVKVFIYLSDTDKEQGPHCFVKGSCNIDSNRIIKNYKSSQRLSQKMLSNHFKDKDFKTIIGKKGTIILGDTSCFHKGMPIINGARLMMNLEYASTLFGSSVNYFNTIPEEGILRNVNNDIKKRIFLNYDPNGFKNFNKNHANLYEKFKRLRKNIFACLR